MTVIQMQPQGPEFPEDDARPWRNQFGDFDDTTMPVMPEGFEDESWENDTCPSFHHSALGLTIFVDYAKPEMREFPDSDRFTLHSDPRDAKGSRPADSQMEVLLSTDDWFAILSKVADIESELERQVRS